MKAMFRLLLLPMVAFVLSLPAAASDTGIEWHVENPFRLFLDPKSTQMHADEYAKLSEEERKSPVLSIERRLSASHPQGWSADAWNRTCWDDKRKSYRFCQTNGSDYINPRSHKIVARYTGAYEDADRCEWTMMPIGKSRQTALGRRQMALCGDEVSWDIPYPYGARLTVAVKGSTMAQMQIAVRDLFIVGLGDSFASGEGNPDVAVQFSDERAAGYGLDPDGQPLEGYPTRRGEWEKMGDTEFLREAALWQSRSCHRSLYSYQLRAALQLAIEDPHRAVTFVGFACSGSEVTIGLFLRYKGNEWDRYPPQLPQLSYISEELCGRGETSPKDYTSGYTQMGKLPELQGMVLNKCYQPLRQIDLLLVSIGGNDVGFSRLVANAVLADQGLLRQLGGWMGSVQSAKGSRRVLDTLRTRYAALNKAFHYMLRIPWQESDRIILTAYPHMAYREDGRSLCPSGNLGMDLYSDFSADASKLDEDEKFADDLFRVMKASAQKSGWTFVDEHRQEFAAHGYCARGNTLSTGSAEVFELPRRDGERWAPYAPSGYRAYASRQRWYRTPNDAYMTVHFHALDPITRQVLGNKRLKWFQIIMAGTYSGSFHPTAEGHAAIADAVVRRARGVLDKYAGRPPFVAAVPKDERE